VPVLVASNLAIEVDEAAGTATSRSYFTPYKRSRTSPYSPSSVAGISIASSAVRAVRACAAAPEESACQRVTGQRSTADMFAAS
jgi:hypothetical protein